MTDDVRFMIEKDGVYYMTTGDFLTYDPKATKGDPEKEKGVKEVAKKFKEIKDSPHTWYTAVELTDSNFRAINTGTAP
jgi:hypothetical protein